MEKLLSGKVAKIRHRLHLAVEQEVMVKNEMGGDVGFVVEENCDGSHPTLVLILKKFRQRRRTKT